MEWVVTYGVIVGIVAWLVVAAVRSSDGGRWIRLLAQVFLLSLLAWVVSSLTATLFADDVWVPYTLFELARPAAIVGVACFVALAFLLMLRTYRRQ